MTKYSTLAQNCYKHTIMSYCRELYQFAILFVTEVLPASSVTDDLILINYVMSVVSIQSINVNGKSNWHFKL